MCILGYNYIFSIKCTQAVIVGINEGFHLFFTPIFGGHLQFIKLMCLGFVGGMKV